MGVGHLTVQRDRSASEYSFFVIACTCGRWWGSLAGLSATLRHRQQRSASPAHGGARGSRGTRSTKIHTITPLLRHTTQIEPLWNGEREVKTKLEASKGHSRYLDAQAAVISHGGIMFISAYCHHMAIYERMCPWVGKTAMAIGGRNSL